MSFNPYTAQRATTPPLYYRRPEGVAPSYFTVPVQQAVNPLSIPAYPTPRHSATRPEERLAYGGEALHPTTTAAAAGAGAPASHYYPASSPSFAGHPTAPPTPRVNGPPMELFRPSDGISYGAGAGRWPYGPNTSSTSIAATMRSDDSRRRLAQMDSAEAALAAEEAALRVRHAELIAVRRQQEGEQLRLSEGWAALLEREERYYTEPVPDLSADIAAREQQCVMLRGQLQQAEDHRGYLDGQLAQYDYVLREKQTMEAEVARVREALQGVEQRRRACIARAERFFDVETKRAIEAGRAARKLDAQLKEMTATGPLAQLQAANSTSRSQSRCVSFAPADKSVVIDVGCNGSASTSASVEPHESRTQGLSMDQEASSSNTTDPRRVAGAAASAASYRSAGLGDPSLCLGLEDEEEIGIGGTSVAFSLNNSAPEALSKRRKVELLV